MSTIGGLVDWNRQHGSASAQPGMSPRPGRRVAIVTCMDTRIEPGRVLGIAAGDAHVLRNAGAVVTEDVIRSLVLSQVALGTEEIMVIGHTRCGVEGLDTRAVRTDVEHQRGRRPLFDFHGFPSVTEEVRSSVRTLERSPFLEGTVRGFVYDVDSGALNPVEA